MSDYVQVSAIQSSFTAACEENIAAMDQFIREAATGGSQIILMPELFEGLYFPQEQREEDLARALPLSGHQTITHYQELAKELEVVLPVSFYERDGPCLYNSVAVIDADGTVLGVYRKSHIPDGPGYQEKFYFRPGDTGFKVWQTRYARIGVGICWDQWFPEAARSMVLAGAELLLYPTAIGSEPDQPALDTKAPWQRVMQGHAVANACPIIAANRRGVENKLNFYGSSFICDQQGEILAQMDRAQDGIISAKFERKALEQYRDSFGFFR
ncbi:MAG: N-carbamoylputrescine amidase, partial [Kofleriaceae bacterium]|nr:N-carbamoylputrescine amidase [Kofleriaceae bacterium]